MKKAQKNFKFLKISIPFILAFSLLPFFNLHYLLLLVFVSKPITMLLVPTWFLAFLFSFKEEVFGFKVKKETREKVLFYTIFITFIVFYLALFSGNLPIIVAQTSTTTTTTPQTCSGVGGTCLDVTFCKALGKYCLSSNYDCTGESCCCVQCIDDADCGCDTTWHRYRDCGDTDHKCYNAVTHTCRAACGASSACDGKMDDSLYDTNGDGYNELYCDAYCLAFVCDSDCKTSAGASYSGFKCYYVWSGGSGHWSWSTSVPDAEDGNPWQECFDGHDNDCDGKTDCADPGCAKVKNQDTGVICCQSDSDCPSYNPTNHLKMYCDPNTHTCKTIRSCSSNDQCDNGWCCDTITGARDCKARGTTLSSGGKSYLCDP